MIKLLVVADDFTGAQDTGVKFSQKGISTIVTTKLSTDWSVYGNETEVLVIDTESRHISKEEASKRVYESVKQALENGVEYIYKKTDSTLRGNIGAELEACMKAAEFENIMFIPAYPQTGRTTINGNQYLNDIPLNETVFSKDPLEPIDTAYIPDIIAKQSNVNVISLSYDDLLNNKKDIKEKDCIYVFDSSSVQDMKNIGFFLKERNHIKVTAGCAGFAEILSDIIKFKKSEIKPEKKEGYTFTVCGSVNKVSIKQTEYALQHGYTLIPLFPEQILNQEYFYKEEGQNLIKNIVREIKNNKKIILKTEGRTENYDKFIEYAKEKGIPQEKLHVIIAESLGKITAEIIKQTKIGNIIVFGGDTALGIMDAISCHGASVKKEISPGVPISEIICDEYHMNLITKAGGFGEDDILIKIEDYINKL